MTINTELLQLASHLGINAPDALLSPLQESIEEALASLTLFDDVMPTLAHLQVLGIPIAIGPNLAKPYGIIIEKLLSQFPLLTSLSYEVGFIKPDPEYTKSSLIGLELAPKHACL